MSQQGERTVVFPPRYLQILLDRAAALDFEHLEPDYSLAVTDCPTVVLRLRLGSSRKEVRDYAPGVEHEFTDVVVEPPATLDTKRALDSLAVLTDLLADQWLRVDEVVQVAPRPPPVVEAPPVPEPFELELESSGPLMFTHGDVDYRLRLAADGSVHFTGLSHVVRQGEFEGRLTPAEIAVLAERAARLNLAPGESRGRESGYAIRSRVRVRAGTTESGFDLVWDGTTEDGGSALSAVDQRLQELQTFVWLFSSLSGSERWNWVPRQLDWGETPR